MWGQTIFPGSPPFKSYVYIYLGNLVRFSIYKGWNFPFLLGDILNIPLKGSI